MPNESNTIAKIEINHAKSFGENRRAVNDDFEVRYVTHMLLRHNGNISRAAREAQMDRKHFHDLCKKHDVSRDSLGIER